MSEIKMPVNLLLADEMTGRKVVVDVDGFVLESEQLADTITKLQAELTALRNFVRSQISFETGFLYGYYTRDSGFCIDRESVGDTIATGKDCLEAWENLRKEVSGK